MIPQTNDPECQEYIDNMIAGSYIPEKTNCKMCETEFILIVSWLEKEVELLKENFLDEGHICEKHLHRIEAITKILRQCKNEEKP